MTDLEPKPRFDKAFLEGYKNMNEEEETLKQIEIPSEAYLTPEELREKSIILNSFELDIRNRVLCEVATEKAYPMGVKAGYKQGVKDSYETAKMDEELAKKAGRREIIDWVKNNATDTHSTEVILTFYIKDWNLFLKELEEIKDG